MVSIRGCIRLDMLLLRDSGFVKGTRDSLSRFRERIMRNAGHNTSLLRSLIALVGISNT